MRRRDAGASPSLLRALSCSLAAPTYGPEVFRDVHSFIERTCVAATNSDNICKACSYLLVSFCGAGGCLFSPPPFRKNVLAKTGGIFVHLLRRAEVCDTNDSPPAQLAYSFPLRAA